MPDAPYSDNRLHYCMRMARRWIKFQGNVYAQNEVSRHAAGAFRKAGALDFHSAVTVDGWAIYLKGGILFGEVVSMTTGVK